MSEMNDWNDKVMAEFHENNGTVQRFGRNLVIMHTVGAKSGEKRLNPVMAIPEDGTWLVAATAAGAENDPAWAHNLRANPDIDLEVATADGIATVAVHTVEESEPARSTDWDKFKAASPGFASYEEKTDRTFPIFRFSPR
jgi:deazaflavin-dependent oxidoreductase (nitroreductase family)